MIRINEPSNAFKDYNNLISCMGAFETKDRIIHQMPKSDAIRSASQQASVHVWNTPYSLSIYFTTSGMTLMETGFHMLKGRKIYIANEDVEGFEISGNCLFFYIKNYEKYGLKNCQMMINFEDFDRSTPEILDAERVKHHYRKTRSNLISADRISAALISNGFECEVI